MEPRRLSPVKSGGAGTGSGASPSSSNMAIPAMAPQTAQPSGFSSTENLFSSGGDGTGMEGASSRASSHVAYLRQHYADKKISGEATNLLLSSWRQKSAQSYDSLCKKWIGWCTEQGYDPISGPIEDVVNFLAHLYSEGYQCRSLGTYRSVIASLHTPVDSASIGQHPLVSRLQK